MKTAPTLDYPVLVTAPGMTLTATAAASTVRCKTWTDASGRGVAQPSGPHRVRLEHPTRGFEVPAGLFTTLEARHDVVQRVLATPHVGYLDGPAAVAAIDGLVKEMAKKGWVWFHAKGLALLPARLPRAEEERLGLWRNGCWVAELRIRRAVQAGTPLAAMLQLTLQR